MAQTISFLGFGLLIVLVASFAGKSEAFKPKFHSSISKAALKSVSANVGGKIIEFDTCAINEIVKANKGVDSFTGLTKNWWHFDDEEFPKASKRIIDLKKEAIAKITAVKPDGAAGRKALGQAIHTLQDFYSHSNWVEIGNKFTNDDLGQKEMAKPKPATKVCPVKPETLGGVGFKCLTSGYFIIKFGSPIGCVPPPKGKCWHGYAPGGCEGIHKDEMQRPSFNEAKGLAEQATTNFVEQLLNDKQILGNAKAIEALMLVKKKKPVIKKRTGLSPSNISIPIDSSIDEITVSVTLEGESESSINLMRPDGSLWLTAKNNTTAITKQGNTTIVTVVNPEVGQWSLLIFGTSNAAFAMEVLGDIPRNTLFSDLIEPIISREGEQYQFIMDQPVIGTNAMMLATIPKPHQTAEFRLVDENGSELLPLSFVEGNPIADEDEVVGNFTVPNEAFQLMVYGLDENGFPYERLYPDIYRPQTVSINLLSISNETSGLPLFVQTNTSIAIPFEVKNLNNDDSATFNLMTNITGPLSPSDPSPSQLTLDPGETGYFDIGVVRASDACADPITGDPDAILTVTAISVSDIAVFNTANVQISVDCGDDLASASPSAFPSTTPTPPPQSSPISTTSPNPTEEVCEEEPSSEPSSSPFLGSFSYVPTTTPSTNPATNPSAPTFPTTQMPVSGFPTTPFPTTQMPVSGFPTTPFPTTQMPVTIDPTTPNPATPSPMLDSTPAPVPRQDFPYGYIEPEWYARIAADAAVGNSSIVNLKRCVKRNPRGPKAIPVTGQRKCSRVPKTCFFGSQTCSGVGAHPTLQCFCDGAAGSKTWICTAVTYPSLS